jgi:hypothetical protein
LDILNHLSTILSIYEYFIHMDVIFAHVARTLEYTDPHWDGPRESGIRLRLT